MAARTLDSLRTAGALRSSGRSPIVIDPYVGPDGAGIDSGRSQFVVVLKPQLLCGEQSSVEARLRCVAAVLDFWQVEIGGVVALPQDYVAEHEIVRRTYPTLNIVARVGSAALVGRAQAALEILVAQRGLKEVFGAYPFLASHNDLSPRALCLLANSISFTKLAAGAYLFEVNHFGRRLGILNAFHPHQHDLLSTGPLLAIECWSSQPFSEIRTKLGGHIFPAESAEHTLRGELYRQRDTLLLEGDSPQLNYVHVSPGPLEAAAQLCLYFSDLDSGNELAARRTLLGALTDASRIPSVLSRAILETDGARLASERFDATESLTTRECIAHLSTRRPGTA